MLHRFPLAPGISLDARRAVWLEEEQALVVADLHLGYAWAQRADGNLLPLSAPDDTIERLAALVAEYRPREVLVLGDIVHRAYKLEPIRQELQALCSRFSHQGDIRLQLIAGNHDRALASLLKDCAIALPLVAECRLGSHLFLHGDRPARELEAGEDAFTFMGHEHPSITLGDGLASVKCPCFLISQRVVILPAFSSWAAGSDIRTSLFMSPLARAVTWKKAVAILSGKLLPLPL